MHKYVSLYEDFIIEAYEKDYLAWKRKNVSLRGIKDIYNTDNDGMAKYGSGLYTVPLSNRSMAKEYGKVYFLVNAIPKHPKIVLSVNDAEMFMQDLVSKYCKENGVKRDNWYFSENTTIPIEMEKLGYDGLIIKGREMVNYKPENILYFENENQLHNYYENKYMNK